MAGEGMFAPFETLLDGYLEAVRSVFTDAATPHEDVTPADTGLGPYDVPGMLPQQQ